MKKDLALGIITLAIAAGYYVMASAIPQSALADEIGPDRLPKTYAVLLAALSLFLVVRSLRARDAPVAHVEHRTLWRAAGMLMIGVVYVASVPWLGYPLSLAGLIVATTHYQGGRVNGRVVMIAVSGAVFFWLLFVMLLGIPQPPGFWPSLL